MADEFGGRKADIDALAAMIAASGKVGVGTRFEDVYDLMTDVMCKEEPYASLNNLQRLIAFQQCASVRTVCPSPGDFSTCQRQGRPTNPLPPALPLTDIHTLSPTQIIAPLRVAPVPCSRPLSGVRTI